MKGNNYPKRSGLEDKSSRTDLDQTEFDMTKKISKTTKEVMKKIKMRKIKMKPRAYFVAGSMLLGGGVVGVLLLTVMITGAVFFHLRTQGTFSYLRMGGPGFGFFVRMFPWKLVGLSLVGFMGGSWMLKKHDKAYKIGLGWLVLGAVVTILGLGFLLDKSGINERLLRGPARGLYKMNTDDREKIFEEMKARGMTPRPEMMRPFKPGSKRLRY